MSWKETYRQWAPFFVIAVIGALIGGGLVMAYGQKFAEKPPATALQESVVVPGANATNVSEARNTAIVRAAQAVGPAVVGITNKAYARDFFNRKVVVERGTGSGVIFDKRGYIATNYHVVEEAKEIVVSLADGRTVDGRVLGVDPITDLAVVKIEADNLPVAALGDSDSLLVGEPAIAIGNPLGLEFKGSVTAGVISAVNRSLEIGERRFKLIQTDAAINPGNSGGALVDIDGNLVGINSAIYSRSGGSMGIGFAIPVSTARQVMESLIRDGQVTRGWIGVEPRDLTPEIAETFNLPLKEGVLITGVLHNGPAALGGVRPGDVVVEVAGQKVANTAQLLNAVAALKPGEPAQLRLLRGSQGVTATVTVAKRPRMAMPAQQDDSEE